MIEIKNRYTEEVLHRVESASLIGIDLTGVNLICANLTFANLTSANLTDANLSGIPVQRGHVKYKSDWYKPDQFRDEWCKPNPRRID
jgi:hypothetical protein